MATSTDIPFRYATAWLDAAEDQKVLAEVREEIKGIQGLLSESEDFAGFLHDRSLPTSVKQELIGKIFEGKLQPISLNFLLLVAAKKREPLLGEILTACTSLLDDRDGIENAEVVSAVEMTEDQVGALRGRLESFSGKTVRIKTSVDESLLGGFVAHLGDVVFDSSLRVHVKNVKQSLIGQ